MALTGGDVGARAGSAVTLLSLGCDRGHVGLTTREICKGARGCGGGAAGNLVPFSGFCLHYVTHGVRH